MLIDLLNSSNYIMVNRDAIRILGLNTAVYCAELLNIYKKAFTKKKLYNETFFKIDREYIKKQTSIEIEDQLKCDANLLKVNIINVDKDDHDIISFNIETFASILACEDVKLQENVSEKVKVNNPKGVKQAQRERYILSLKEAVECKNFEVLQAIRGWIDSLMADPNMYLSKPQVVAFKNTLDSYCDGDVKKAIEVINLATVHQYVDCQWAINLHERGNKPVAPRANITNTPRVTLQKKTVAVGDDIF